MDINSEIYQRFFFFSTALVLAVFFALIAWKQNFFQIDSIRGSGKIGMRLSDVLKIFSLFLFVEVFLIPGLVIGWIFFKTGNFSIAESLDGTKTKGWINLMTILSGAFVVLGYCLCMDTLKRRVIFWGSSERSFSRLLTNLAFGSLTWLYSYPFVLVIGQLAGILTSYFGLSQHVEQVAVKHLRETMQYPSLFTATVISIILFVPMAEEILFRGFFQKWLIEKWGRLNGIVVTSIVFALFHFSFSQKWDNIELLLSLLVLSCFLGYIYEKQGTLWAPIGLHMTFNAISILIILMTAPASIFAQIPHDDDEIKEPPPTQEMIESYLQATIQGNNAFAFDLYHKLKGAPGNLCFSPYSISSALALPFVGARGATQGDMRVVMHYLNKANQVINMFALLDKLYTTPWYLGQNESKLFFGNSLWVNRDAKLLPSFTNAIPSTFRPAIKNVDFSRNPEGARLNINEWVREKTQGRISKQVNREDLGPNLQMLVVSSIFMKGVWSHPFNPSLSKESPFFINQTTTGSVNMMVTSGKFRMHQKPDLTLIELPYRPNFKGIPTLALVIVLPTSNFGLASIEEKFYLENWNSWVAQLKEEGVVVSLPSFSFLQSFDLSNLLKGMGMSFAFSDQADFSDMSIKEDFQMGRVLHEAYFMVDERGSDAISANPVTINTQALLSKTTTYAFTVNHPFLFLVVDKTNNIIIYMGRFLKP